MISWIVASHNREILLDTLAPGLAGCEEWGDEVVIVEGAPSIASAYTEGQDRATRPIRCYVHHDVRVLALSTLRAQLIDACRADVGLVGVIGSRSPVLPWWEGDRCGSVVDSRLGLLDFGPGGHACAYLDGLLLATAQDLTWDLGYSGWHMYDHDQCRQQIEAGRSNWCLANGRHLVRHETTGPTSTSRLDTWAEGVERFRVKWSTAHESTP